MRQILFPLLLLAPLLAGAANAPRDEPVPGGIALVPLAPASSPAPTARLADRPVMVIPRDGFWTAVVGIDLDTAPGAVTLQIAQGDGSTAVHRIQVRPKEYAAQHITIKDRRKVEPSAQDLKRIAREHGEIERAFRSFRTAAGADAALAMPVNGRLSSPFGLRRYFNGKPRRPHSGIDIAAPAGTPVHAPGAGVIHTVGSYFFNGNTVFIDHGQGLVSMLCHLQSVSVKPGQRVARGDVVGRVGSTGRATGPHLHWSVSLNDARVDPDLLMPAPPGAPARQ
jgi:murein DD-endopeptidase MepM/ murein hydrolase activator NlpD